MDIITHGTAFVEPVGGTGGHLKFKNAVTLLALIHQLGKHSKDKGDLNTKFRINRAHR